MEIKRQGTSALRSGPAEYFTGSVSIRDLFSTAEPGRAIGAFVSFQPGARTAWHTHPLGQTLIVTEGRGFVQSFGEEVHEVLSGDVISFAAGEKHWHGAAPDSAMSHIAIQEQLDGRAVDWLEHVSEQQYSATD